MRKNQPTQKTADKRQTKQMKVFLSLPEHAVVVAAASTKDMNICDYMKKVVIEQAKKDAKNIAKIIDSI